MRISSRYAGIRSGRGVRIERQGTCDISFAWNRLLETPLSDAFEMPAKPGERGVNQER